MGSKASYSLKDQTVRVKTNFHSPPVIVYVGCGLCNNEPSFRKGEHIPLPPLPPVAVLRKCPSRNHHKCFTKCLEQDLFQAHSVEEMVVWIVESEKDCSFEEFLGELQLDEPKGGALVG